ncbi:9126_t:CDS:10, partial [Racocetra fulgida]
MMVDNINVNPEEHYNPNTTQQFTINEEQLNLKDAIIYLNQQLNACGYHSSLDFFNNNDEKSVTKIVDCISALLQQQQKDAAYREEMHDQHQKLQTELSEREVDTLRAKLIKTEDQLLSESERHRSTKDELIKTKANLQNVKSQAMHDIRKRDTEYTRFKEKMQKVLNDKYSMCGPQGVNPPRKQVLRNTNYAASFISSDVDVPVLFGGLSHMEKNSEKIKQGDGDADARDKDLLQENSKLRKLLFEVHNQVISFISSQTQMRFASIDPELASLKTPESYNSRAAHTQLPFELFAQNLEEEVKDLLLALQFEWNNRPVGIIEDFQQKDEEKDKEIMQKNFEIKQKDDVIKQNEYVIKQKDGEIKQKDHVIKQKDYVIKQKDDEIKQKDYVIKQKDDEIKQRDDVIKQRDDMIKPKDYVIKQKDDEIKQKNIEIKQKSDEIKQKDCVIKQKDDEIKQKDYVIKQKDDEIRQKDYVIKQKDDQIKQKDYVIKQKEDQIKQKDYAIRQKDDEIKQKNVEIKQKNAEIKQKNVEIKQRDDGIKQKDTIVQQQEAKIGSLGNQLETSAWKTLRATPEINGVEIPIDISKPNPNNLEFDNLYLDMNGIIHPCCHPEGKPAPETEDDMMIEIFKYTERIISIVRPRKVLYLAIDGVAPRAKMNQQRSRRFRTAQEDRIKNEERAKEIENLKVILSDASVPGEGEHKIMDFIRGQRSSPYHDPNTRHDADLIMLSLSTHEPHFKVLREDVFFNDGSFKVTRPKSKDNGKNVDYNKPYVLLNIETLREYLGIELRVPSLPWPFDLENAIDDWVFLCFFVGNDFLPHLPSLEIREGAIDTLISIWKRCLQVMNGYITNCGNANHLPVGMPLLTVKGLDSQIRARTNQEVVANRQALRMANLSAAQLLKAELSGLEPPVHGVEPPVHGVDPPVHGVDPPVHGVEPLVHTATSDATPTENLITLQSSQTTIITPTPQFSTETLKVSTSDEDTILSSNSAGTKRKFSDDSTQETHVDAKNIIEESGEPAQWYYPYHYSPFASDFIDIGDLKINFELGEPFKPFEQLMGVLPAGSKEHLPVPFHQLMTSQDSEIIDFYPSDFRIDLNGKRYAWQ